MSEQRRMQNDSQNPATAAVNSRSADRLDGNPGHPTTAQTAPLCEFDTLRELRTAFAPALALCLPAVYPRDEKRER